MDLYPENVVEAVEGVCQGAVDIEPPVAGEILLVEDRAVGAEQLEVGEGGVEGVLVHADVEHLAVSLHKQISKLKVAVATQFRGNFHESYLCQGHLVRH